MRRSFLFAALLAAAPVAAAADTIELNNGRVIEADRAWIEGSQVMYEKHGGVFGLPKTLVKRLEQKAPSAAATDPDVLKARARLQAGDPVGATRLLLQALGRDPESLAALQTLSEAYLSLGDPGRARDAATKAVRADERNARSRALLGDALVALGDRAAAEGEYRKSLQLHPDPAVERKLGEVAPPPARPAQGAQFRIRYDGGVNEPLGVSVLQMLTQAYGEYQKRLGFTPDEPVTVVLQTETAFQEEGAPDWAAGVNDGVIRIAVRGMERPTPPLVTTLRHELAHSFIASRTGGNCPTWLQEGIAQWLEGGEPSREDGRVAGAIRQRRLIPLVSLEAPFRTLSEADAALAYAESLSAVAFIVRSRGEVGIVRLLAALADRLPSEEAIPVALALSYPELQRAWEQDLVPAGARSPSR